MTMALLDSLKVSCDKATALIEQRQFVGLSLSERARLYMHLRICRACRTYEEQSTRVDRWLEERRDTCACPDASAVCERVLESIR